MGESKTAFHVHEDLLCQHSSFFTAAFSSKFREGSEKEMVLLEDDEDAFESFVDWLYTQRRDYPPIDTEQREAIAKMKHLRLYILADKYDVPPLKKRVLSDMMRLFKDCTQPPTCTVLGLAYSELPRKSGMRRLLLDWCIEKSDPSWYDQPDFGYWLHGNPEFAVDLIKGLTKRAATTKHWRSALWGPVSAYYDEDSG